MIIRNNFASRVRVFSLCAVLLWSLWRFNSPAEASSIVIDLTGAGDSRTLLDDEAVNFNRRLDEVAMREHGRFQRSLRSLHRSRMRREAVSDFRHGFIPGTGVGNREDFSIASLELLAHTAVLNKSVSEWGYVEIGNQTVVAASTKDAVLLLHLQPNEPAEPLSVTRRFSNLTASEIFSLPQWQAGHIVNTKYYLTICDSLGLMTHYLVTKNSITLQESVDVGSSSVVDLQHFAFDLETYLGVLTNDGFARLYKWSGRYLTFSLAEDLTVPVPVSNMQAFDISGRHYLLVSAPEANSTLFKYNTQQGSFWQYQLLYPEGAKRATYFSDAYEHYLVFIDAFGLTSTFFKWSGVKFVEMQVISTVGANHWHSISIPGTQDGALLILSSEGSAPGTRPLTPYKHDPVTDSFQVLNDSAVIAALNPEDFYNATSTLSFHVDTDVYLLVGVSKHLSPDEPGNLFKMSFINVETDDPVVVESLQLEAFLNQTQSTILNQTEELAKARQTISESVTKNGSQVIQGIKTFKDVVLKEVEAENVDVEDAHIYALRPTGNESLSYLVNQSIIQQQQITSYLAFLSDAVTLNTTQTIIGAKNITSVTIEGALNATTFSTKLFDDVDIDELDRQAFRLNVPNQVINGTLTFSGNLSTKSIDLDDGYLVNGVDLSEDVVVTFGAQTIRGNKIFQKDTSIQDDMDLGSGVLLNGIDPSEQLVTLEGQHVLAGQLNFTYVIHIDGDIVTPGTVDGVNVSDLCKDVMTISTDQTITGPLVFQQSPVFDTNVVYGGLLRGVDITRIANEAVMINQDAEITGRKNFVADVSVTGDVIVGGNVSGVDLQQNVAQLKVGGTMAGPRVFRGPVTVAGVMDVDGHVNGLNLERDIVTLEGNQTVEGKKNFVDGIDAAQAINVTGTVDTVDLSEWATDVMTLSTNQTVQGPVEFLDDVNMKSNLTVGLINGIDLQELYKDTFFKMSDLVQIISGAKTFTKPVTVTVGHIVIKGLINSFNMTEDFLNKFSDQTVTKRRAFINGFSADAGMNVSGLIAGIDLMTLYDNSLIRGRQAHLYGKRTFSGSVTIHGIVNVTGPVNGIELATDVLTIHGNQVVTGLKAFQRLEAVNMSSQNVTATVSVNKKNLTDFVLTRVDLTSDQEIFANHSFEADNVTVSDVVIKWMVNGVNLTALLGDIMSRTTEQTVTGSKTVDGIIVVRGNVSLGDRINGIRLSEFPERALLLDGPLQVISGSKTFEDFAILSEHLELTGLLDGLDLDFFMSDVIFPDKLQKILATKIFLNGTHTKGDISVTGTVDGIDLSTEVMTKSTSQNISGSWTITEAIISTAPDTIVTGLINGIDLVYLNDSILKRTGDQTVNSPLVFMENLTSTTDVTVTGLVDGIDLSEFEFKAVRLDEPLDLQGNVTFAQGVTFNDSLDVRGLINGVNLSAWYQDVVLLDTDEVILGNKTFTNSVTVSEVLNVVGDMEVDTVFGQDFDNFVTDAVNLTGDVTITGKKIFTGDVNARADVSVDETVDGIYIEDVVTKDGNEIITGVKNFTQNITVNGHINVTGLVNGVDISDIYQRTFKLDEPQNITAVKEFVQNVTVTENIFVGGSVDGVDLDREAVTLDTDQTINGTIFFNTSLTVNGNMMVGGSVGGVNLTELVTERATLSGHDAVRGGLTFQGHVTFLRDIAVSALFDGISVSGLWDLQEALLRWVWLDIKDLLWVSEYQCEAVEKLRQVYSNALEYLGYLFEIQEIDFRSQSFEAFQLKDASYLAQAVHADRLNNLCVDSYIYTWNGTGYEFVEEAAFASNGAYSWRAFERDGTSYLALANEGTNPCGGVSAANTVFYYNGSHFVELQNLAADQTRHIEVAVINDDLYLAVANTKTSALSTIYLQAADRLFYAVQNFSVGGATAVDFVHTGSETFLVFAAVSPSQSPVYVFNSQSGQFEFHQYIPSSYAASLESFTFKGNFGLVFANHAFFFANNRITYDVPIEVYYWSATANQFELSETVGFTAAVDVETFSVGPDLYLAAVSEYEQLQIYRYEGIVGFSSVIILATFGAVSIEVFEMPDLPRVVNLFFALAVDPYTEDEVASRIFRERTFGASANFEILLCDVEVEDVFHGDPRLLDAN